MTNITGKAKKYNKGNIIYLRINPALISEKKLQKDIVMYTSSFLSPCEISHHVIKVYVGLESKSSQRNM